VENGSKALICIERIGLSASFKRAFFFLQLLVVHPILTFSLLCKGAAGADACNGRIVSVSRP
jgi:hypothetical protein